MAAAPDAIGVQQYACQADGSWLFTDPEASLYRTTGVYSHGRLSGALLGSTSQSVVRQAPCPIVVVRERAG